MVFASPEEEIEFLREKVEEEGFDEDTDLSERSLNDQTRGRLKRLRELLAMHARPRRARFSGGARDGPRVEKPPAPRDLPTPGRGAAAGASWTFRGAGSRPRREVPRGYSEGRRDRDADRIDGRRQQDGSRAQAPRGDDDSEGEESSDEEEQPDEAGIVWNRVEISARVADFLRRWTAGDARRNAGDARRTRATSRRMRAMPGMPTR